MTDADWLAAVAAAPDDPLVRLVYADWLDDHNDPRAELLRLDVTLAGLADDDPAAEPLRQRLAELVPGTDARWRAAVCRVPAPEPSHRDWYIATQCPCGQPEAVAGELFDSVAGQPHQLVGTPVGRRQVMLLGAATVACDGRAVRYGGTDPVVIRLLGNTADRCDYLLPVDGPEMVLAPSPVADPLAVSAAPRSPPNARPPRRIPESYPRLLPPAVGPGGYAWVLFVGAGILLGLGRLIMLAVRD